MSVPSTIPSTDGGNNNNNNVIIPPPEESLTSIPTSVRHRNNTKSVLQQLQQPLDNSLSSVLPSVEELRLIDDIKYATTINNESIVKMLRLLVKFVALTSVLFLLGALATFFYVLQIPGIWSHAESELITFICFLITLIGVTTLLIIVRARAEGMVVVFTVTVFKNKI